MKWYDTINLWVAFLCGPADQAFIWAFGFVPSILKVVCASMLILTAGKILDFYERKTYYLIKIILYVWFFIYTLYCLEFIEDLGNLSVLDWSSLLFGLLAPITVLIFGIWLKNQFKAKTHFDFYYILMVFYLILGALWFALRPENINFSMFCFYWSVLLLAVYIFSHIATKGALLSVQGNERSSLLKRSKILIKLAIGTIIYTIVFDWLIELNPEKSPYPENWLIGMVGLIPSVFLTMLFYNGRKKHIFVFLTFFFLSWFACDISDFIAFVSTLVGFILFVVSLACSSVLVLIFKKRAEYAGMAILFTIVYCAIFAFFFSLNNEKIVENWVLGLFFTLMFSALYLLPPGKLWIMSKKVHMFMIIFWLSWFLIDLSDFTTAIIHIYV